MGEVLFVFMKINIHVNIYHAARAVQQQPLCSSCGSGSEDVTATGKGQPCTTEASKKSRRRESPTISKDAKTPGKLKAQQAP